MGVPSNAIPGSAVSGQSHDLVPGKRYWQKIVPEPQVALVPAGVLRENGISTGLVHEDV
jgi:hypothetical protein